MSHSGSSLPLRVFPVFEGSSLVKVHSMLQMRGVSYSLPWVLSKKKPQFFPYGRREQRPQFPLQSKQDEEDLNWHLFLSVGLLGRAKLGESSKGKEILSFSG